MTSSRIMKWITGSFEAFLGIPFLGALIVISSSYSALIVMLALHIVTLILSVKNKESIYGSVVGVVTSIIAWIPFVGMIMHIISAVLLMVSGAQSNNNSNESQFKGVQ